MAFRLVAVFVLLWVAADLGDPTVPGVFSFASDRLFVDSVVQAKTAAPIADTTDCPGGLTALSSRPLPMAVKRPARALTAWQVASHQHQHRSHRPAFPADTDRPDADPLA